MQNCKWTEELVTLDIAVVALASSLAPSKAQAQENFAWITNTNGVTWKKSIDNLRRLDLGSCYGVPEIAEIVVPKHAIIDFIDVVNCVNLTNIVLHPARPAGIKITQSASLDDYLLIYAGSSGLRTITCKKTMRDLIDVYLGYSKFQAGGWATFQRPVQWIELLPKMEIKTLSTDNGKELEVSWEYDGKLQIADAVNGKWKDYSGNSPLRIPLWLGAKDKQFFRIRKGDD